MYKKWLRVHPCKKDTNIIKTRQDQDSNYDPGIINDRLHSRRTDPIHYELGGSLRLKPSNKDLNMADRSSNKTTSEISSSSPIDNTHYRPRAPYEWQQQQQ